jgi:geranylgeranyl diphosphate synthase type I
MIDRAGFVSLVDARLAATIERERGFYGHLADDEIGSVLSSIAGLVASGGKRTRPEFAHLGWIAAGGEERAQTVVNIGAALELLHVSALIHDDIIDGARTRRGAPTIHVGLAGRHRAESWTAGCPRVPPCWRGTSQCPSRTQPSARSTWRHASNGSGCATR